MGLITCFAAVFSCPGQSSGAGQSGNLGDPAPPLTVLEWIKGKPVKIQPGTNFYVLVFCPLSRAGEVALNNLSSLQQKYRDKGLVTVIISEEAPPQLRTLVQLNGAEMDFTIAADDYAERTLKNYQQAFHQNQLPLAYVISRDGKILWYGHPLTDGMGWVVDDVASGRYNLEQTEKDILSRDQLKEYIALARQKDPQVGPAGQILLGLRTNDAPALCDLAFKIATDPFIEQRDAALATAALDRAAQLSATNTTDIAVDRAILLFQTGQPEAGLAQAQNALTTAQTDDDKRHVQATIRAMQTRLAMAKTNQPPDVVTGPTNAAPAKP
jgi:hypothetical protein